jgi:hypothetical protein
VVELVVHVVVGGGVVVVVVELLGVVVVLVDGAVVVVVVALEARTTGVAFDVATVEPFLLIAVTTTRSVPPLSAPISRYFPAFAALTARQLAPAELHRAHWNE